MTFDTNVVVNNGKSVQTNKVLAPTTSGGSTYGVGTSGQVLTSNGTNAYWGDASGGSSALSLTLVAGSWTSATPPTQTLTATGVTANNNIIVGLAGTATSAQLDDYVTGKILCTAQAENSLTFTCYGDEPTNNVPISVVILG